LVDKSLIMRKLAQLEEYLQQIKGYSSVSIDGYRQDWKTQRIVERTLQIMLEICSDIAGHVIADRRLRVPASYADTFKVLLENELIGPDLYQVMENMAKFRNIIVHHYDKIDETIVVGILRRHLDDFLMFRDAVLKVLD
jgi:uncharacterized protein YutE (UPF0331/DUF86 family)